MKKFKYLILIMLTTFMSVTYVKADTESITLLNPTFYDRDTLITSHSFVTNNTNMRYTGFTTSNSKFTVTFTNDISRYSQLGFYMYNTGTQVNTNYNYNQPVMPLIIMDGYPCSVKPIGIQNNSSGSYDYDGTMYILCDVKDSTSSSHYIDSYQYQPAESTFLIGINLNGNAFTKDTTLSDVQQSVDSVKDSVNDLNDNITSSDTTNSQNQANSFFEGFESDDYGLSDIVTMPLELIKGLTSNICVALFLTLPFVNKTFELPCMSSIYSNYFGSFFTLYQTVTFGFVAYWVIVKIFALVKGFKDPDDDKVEVMDL